VHVFNQKTTAKLVRDVFLPLKIGSCDIQFPSDFKYLRHIINNCMTDDDEINREAEICLYRYTDMSL